MGYIDIIIGAVISSIVTYSTASVRFSAKMQAELRTLETRLAAHELETVKSFVTKEEITALTRDIRDHMLRIEDKLDALVSNTNRPSKVTKDEQQI